MNDDIWAYMLILLCALGLLVGIIAIVNPEAMRKFSRKYPGFDRGNTEASSDLAIRLSGVIAVILVGFMGYVLILELIEKARWQ